MKDNNQLIVASQTDFPAIERQGLNCLQLNLGYLCNLSCTHCHVNAGPSRTELMSREDIDLVLAVIKARSINLLDLTGGAPELNPHFRYLVEQARALGCEIIDRCNLTVLFEPGQEGLAEFLAANEVQVVASLPCYLEDNVDGQRGKGVYQKSIDGLKRLNELGYARKPELMLNLVYNPTGAYLPPAQEALELDYKTFLAEQFSVQFNHLLTITNMPISRFGAVLVANKQYDDYLNLLKDNFSEQNLAQVMCKSLISVDYQGYLYDCDFNQMLGLPLAGKQHHLRDLINSDFSGSAVRIAEHCYACTAGQGSSCSGALA